MNPTIENIMGLADEYAHVYSFVGDDTMPNARQSLRAAIEEALAQPVQEPAIYPNEAYEMGLEAIPYYTAPQPQREWVGLTDEEITQQCRTESDLNDPKNQ
jgi:pyruvate/2-oxoglutarate dehydrogenase complex dihydrolipoamide dehydrogenase (E3) component